MKKEMEKRDQEQGSRSCILDTTAKIRSLRATVKATGTPESIQDGYEEIIDTLIGLLGASDKQKELFWTLSDPE